MQTVQTPESIKQELEINLSKMNNEQLNELLIFARNLKLANTAA